MAEVTLTFNDGAVELMKGFAAKKKYQPVGIC